MCLKKKVEGLLGAGINRVSLGIQSYIDQELQALGRNHDRKSAIQATNILKDINSTIDLIYGIEKQTPGSVAKNLETIIDSNVNHLSLYQLTIEPNTIFIFEAIIISKFLVNDSGVCISMP